MNLWTDRELKNAKRILTIVGYVLLVVAIAAVVGGLALAISQAR